jgi:hypothetical protein
MAEGKSIIIDPLTSICKISILYFMPIGTKLSIYHHKLGIQEYHSYQWIERIKNGDCRFDIANLNYPIFKAIKWYLLDNKEKISMDEESEKSIRIIFSFAIKGLEKMMNHTYCDDISIRIILQYLINLLTDAMEGNWNETRYIIPEFSGILGEKIKTNFDSYTINSIAKMLLDCEKIEKFPNDVKIIVDCIHKLLINREISFSKIMKSIDTNINY